MADPLLTQCVRDHRREKAVFSVCPGCGENFYPAAEAELVAERDRCREALDTIRKLTHDQPEGLFAEETLILHNIAADSLDLLDGCA